MLVVIRQCHAETGELGALDVPLAIQDVAGVERKGDVCSTGVPLPCGLLKEPEGIAVYDPGGKVVPAQFKVLERWREQGMGKGDLSVKWLLVTFFADVPAGKKVIYHLKAGMPIVPPNPVKVEEKDNGFDMGGVLFKKDLSGPFELVLTDPDGKEITAGDLPLKWSIWEQGPVRSCLKVETPTVPDKFGFMAWIYAYAGQKRWDMCVVLKNTPNKARGPFYFKDFSVVWEPVQLKGAKDYMLGGEWGKETKGTLAEKNVYMYQDSDGTDAWDKLGVPRPGSKRYWAHTFTLNWNKEQYLPGVPRFRGYRVIEGEKELGSGDMAQGWAGLSGKSAGAIACIRNFRKQHPKAAEVGPGRIIMRLWPEYWKGHGGLHWLDDMQRKAHDISFQILDKPVGAEVGQAVSRAFDAPLVAYCGLDWYNRTGAYDIVRVLRPGLKTEIKVQNQQEPSCWNWVSFGGDLLDRVRRRYHDYPISKFIERGNPHNAYGTYNKMQHAMCMTPFWVDDYQFPRDKRLIKFGYCSPPRKTGAYRENTAHHGYMAWNTQHFCCEAIFDGWRLFGDPLALEAARNLGAFCQSWTDYRKTHDIGETRQDALPLRNMCEVVRITGDQKLAASLSEFADICWETVDKVRGYYVPNKNLNFFKPKGADKPFMLAHLMQGLRHHYNLTGEERSAEQITGIVDFILAEGGIGKYGLIYEIGVDVELRDKYRETNLKKYEKANQLWYGPRTAPLIAFCYWYTGDETYNDWIKSILPGRYRKKWEYTDWVPQRAAPVPPGHVSDLTAEPSGNGKVRLSWTAPQGNPTLYQIKWSDKPIVKRIKFPEQKDTHANWWAAQNVKNEPAPLAKGEKQSMTVEGVAPGTRYFAIRSFNAQRDRSAMSNTVAVEVK